ncbi:MAG: hypothetical protein JWO74_1763 [Solirubrobacterales bacterium]|nr:hypothetical protein [Solirubrobacterales bacterium]
MQSTLKRLAAVAAVGTIGILAPAAGASAAVATDPATAAFPGADLPGFGFLAGTLVSGGGPGDNVAFALSLRPVPILVRPGVGHATTVVGPTIITTTPSTFINTNNQVSPATQAAP